MKKETLLVIQFYASPHSIIQFPYRCKHFVENYVMYIVMPVLTIAHFILHAIRNTRRCIVRLILMGTLNHWYLICVTKATKASDHESIIHILHARKFCTIFVLCTIALFHRLNFYTWSYCNLVYLLTAPCAITFRFLEMQSCHKMNLRKLLLTHTSVYVLLNQYIVSVFKLLTYSPNAATACWCHANFGESLMFWICCWSMYFLN